MSHEAFLAAVLCYVLVACAVVALERRDAAVRHSGTSIMLVIVGNVSLLTMFIYVLPFVRGG